MSRHRLLLVVGLVVIGAAALAFAALRSSRSVVVQQPTVAPVATATAQGASTAAAMATATARVAATPVPTRPRPQYTAVATDIISPVVVEQSPARGEALAPDGLVRLVFDRPMNRATVEQALSVSGVQGTTAWSDARTVSFTPATPWTRDAVYDVVLGQEATAEDGAVLGSPYQFRFTTAGFLDVAQVIPAQGTTDTAAASVITVVFNRPVVALTSVAQMAQQPQPLRLMADGSDAVVAGTGEWLNTSVYVFRPTAALEGGTRYIATVDAGITDTEGSPLREAYRWEFTVAEPQVLQTLPERDAKLFGVDDALAVTFNQPASSNPDSIRLIAGQTVVAGNVGAVGDTLYFTPTQRLAFDTVYTAEVGAASGLTQPFRWQFHTVPLPRVVSTSPSNGAQKANPSTRSRSTSMRRSTPRLSWITWSGRRRCRKLVYTPITTTTTIRLRSASISNRARTTASGSDPTSPIRMAIRRDKPST